MYIKLNFLCYQLENIVYSLYRIVYNIAYKIYFFLHFQPVILSNSAKILALDFVFGILPTKRRQFPSLILTFSFFPCLIS